MSLKTLKSRNGVASVIAAGLAVAAWGSPAKAVLITPGQSLPATGAGTFGGTLVLDTGPEAFSGLNASTNTVVFTGVLDTKVYSDPANPFGAGDLDFVYQFSNDNNPNNDNILHLSATSFTGFLTNADDVAGSGTAGTFPTGLRRDAAGDTVDFDFPVSSAVYPGTLSPYLVVQTNARSIGAGIVSIQDGGNVAVPSLAPVSVPEPATMAIAGFGLFALGMRRRNARK